MFIDFIDFIDYYDQILTVFFFQEWGLSSFRRWQGSEVGAPSFFFYLIRTSSKSTHLKQDELKPNLEDVFSLS